jgi:dethiobiotin synthetase
MTALFVTATGTDIGKTFVAAGLIRHWRAAGREVDALKPVVSGFSEAMACESDPGELLRALSLEPTLEQIERIAPWRFAAPLSPDMAARREGHTLDYEVLVEFCCKAIARRRGTLLIEGVGGIMVPLDNRHTVLDWMAALGVPLLLVGGSYLGSLSHTLTALDVLRSRNLHVRALVVNETPGSTVALADTAATLERFSPGVPVVTLPRLASASAVAPPIAKIAALF